MFQSIIKWPKIILSAVYEKISEQAKKANISVREYVGNDKNIDHISIVVYDILPLPVKIGLRHDEFNKVFHKYFKNFRNKIYSYEDGLQSDEVVKNCEPQNKEIKIETEVTEEVTKSVKQRASSGKGKIVRLNEKLTFTPGMSKEDIRSRFDEILEDAKKKEAKKKTSAKVKKDSLVNPKADSKKRKNKDE